MVRPQNRPARTSTTAASVPSTLAAVADIAAIRRLVHAASSMAASCQSATYQRVDQPPQMVTSREALNE